MSTPPETTARHLINRHWMDLWVGPTGLVKSHSAAVPAGLPGVPISFDVRDPTHTAPWTPDEVRLQVGYVLASMRELARDTIAIAGLNPAGSALEVPEEIWWQVEFQVTVPRSATPSLAEGFAAELEALYRGVTLIDSATGVSVRNLPGTRPSAYRSGGIGDQFAWMFVDVFLRSEATRSLGGSVTITL